MKVKIKTCVLKLELNFNKFKSDLKNTLNLKEAVNNNMKVIYNTGFKNNVAVRFVYLGFDWGGFFKQLNHIKKDKIQFKIYNVEMDGYKSIVPLTCVMDKNQKITEFEFELKDKKEGVMIVQDGVPNPNFSLDNFFTMNLFDFGGKRYGLRIDLK